MLRRDRIAALIVLATFFTPACVGSNAASNLARPPIVPQDRNTSCRIVAKQREPLIVEWPETSRGKLEALRRRGLVVVRYEGCEIDVLAGCAVKLSKGDYEYEAFERKQARVTIRNEDELFANLPVGAIGLQGKLRAAGQLVIDMTIVGRYESGVHKVLRDQLTGDCETATHVVTDFSVGAFKFEAGADADVGGSVKAPVVGGAGASSAAKRELLARDGDVSACLQSRRTDTLPPEGCGSLIQIEVTPLNEQSSTCAEGLRWSGRECVTAAKKLMLICPIGQHLDEFRCVPDALRLDAAMGQKDPVLRDVKAKAEFGATGGIGWGLGLGSLATLAAGGTLTVYSFVRANEISSGQTGDCDPIRGTCNATGLSQLSTMATLNPIGIGALGVGATAGLLWIFWPKVAAALKLDMKVQLSGSALGVGGQF